MTQSLVAILSEGLPRDLRPICYSRSTWDVPFLGRPLLAYALERLEAQGCRHVILLDDTPGLWLHALGSRYPVSIPVQQVDVRRGAQDPDATLRDLLRSLGCRRLFHLKPCALVDPDLEGLEAFHETSGSQATFALTRLEPGSLSWPFIPACRMDEFGAILEVDKLRRTDALGSANLENVLGASAPSRPREFWAPRNVSILELEVALGLPIVELLAPLAGLARKLAADGVACFGRAMKGQWWPASSTLEVVAANREALRALGGDGGPHDTDSRVGADTRVGEDARIRLSVIGSEAHVGARAAVQGSVLADATRVGAEAIVRDSFVGSGGALPDGANLIGSVMGDGEVQNLSRGVPPGGCFLDGLSTVDEQAVSEYWRKHVPLYGRRATISILDTLAKGIDNNVYHLFDGNHHFVLKRRLDCNAHPLIREFHVLRTLQGRGFAPRPYAVDLRPEVRVAPCIVMEYVPGRPVPGGAITPEIASAIGRTCHDVHTVRIEGLLRDLPELAEQSYPDLLSYVADLVLQYNCYLDARQQQGLEDELGEALADMVGWMHEMAERENTHWQGYVPRVLCQGDLREFNMLVREGSPPTTVALLDWERCGIDDPAYDVGWFLALSKISEEAERAFREAYGPGLPGDRTFWARVEAFRTADILTWPVHLLQMVEDFREHRTPAPDPERLANEYEGDAYRALAAAFNTLGTLRGKPSQGGKSGAREGRKAPAGQYTVESVRGMGPLFV